MKKKIITNFMNVLHEKIENAINEKSIDSKSIYYANINKHWCSVYKGIDYYGLVIRHKDKGLLFYDHFSTEEIAFEAFMYSLKICKNAKEYNK